MKANAALALLALRQLKPRLSLDGRPISKGVLLAPKHGHARDFKVERLPGTL
jgi:hypothetical protein